MKATLTRLGIRGFNPKLKKAAERLDGLRTPEGEPIPPNTLAELRRDMVRRRLVSDQIRQIEDARLERLEHAPGDGPHAMVRLLARVIGVGIETADMLVPPEKWRSNPRRQFVPPPIGRTNCRRGHAVPCAYIKSLVLLTFLSGAETTVRTTVRL